MARLGLCPILGLLGLAWMSLDIGLASALGLAWLWLGLVVPSVVTVVAAVLVCITRPIEDDAIQHIGYHVLRTILTRLSCSPSNFESHIRCSAHFLLKSVSSAGFLNSKFKGRPMSCVDGRLVGLKYVFLCGVRWFLNSKFAGRPCD